jgi:cyclopropane fatty-acyl-phospholipid synthase-like methyltransferase
MSTNSTSIQPPRHTALTYHGPLSTARAERLISRLAATEPGTVLDIGCGWGELMLRILEAAPKATGVGVDIDAPDLARGRANATERGLADRVEFAEESGRESTREPADVVLCLGSSHALSGAEPPHYTTEALRELRRLVRPGGRVVFGEGFWQRPPTDAELAQMWPEANAGEHLSLADVVDLATEAGFRLEKLELATEEEWEDFESAYLADKELWLAANPDHPDAAETKADADRHRSTWLRGYRTVLGIAYLTLVPVG